MVNDYLLIEVLILGRGGQGGATAANIIVSAAIMDGLRAQAFPFFGAERRGAPVKAFARISDGRILRHGMFNEADVLIVMDLGLIRTNYTKEVFVKDGGRIVINSPRDAAIESKSFNLLGKAYFYRVDARAIAFRNRLIVAGWPVVNTPMLGAFSKATGLIRVESIKKAVMEFFEGKVGEVNAIAVEEAFHEVEEFNPISV